MGAAPPEDVHELHQREPEPIRDHPEGLARMAARDKELRSERTQAAITANADRWRGTRRR